MAESAAVVVDTMNTMTTPAASSVRPRKRQRIVTAPSTTATAAEPQTITGVVRSATTDSTLEDSTTAHACNGGGAGGGAGAGAGAGTVVTASPSRPLLLPSRTVRAAAGVPVSPSTAKGAQAIVFCAAFDPVALYDVKTAAHAVLSITNVTQVPTDAVTAAFRCPSSAC